MKGLKPLKPLKSKKQKTDFYSLKLNIVKIGFFVFALLILWRMYHIQILSGARYRDISLKQMINREATPERGEIYFENKNGELVPAAVNKYGYSLAINPNALEQGKEQEIYEKLSQAVFIEKKDFLEKAMKLNDPYEVLATRLNKETVKKIKPLQKEYKGIILAPEIWRFYPTKNLASHVVGFVGFKNDTLTGRYGIESFYNDYLEGKPLYATRSIFGSLLDFGERAFSNYELSGSSLVLTIEPLAQGVLESNLEKVLSDYNASRAIGLIINPQNGKILAMASKPDFNPNEYGNTRDLSVFNNPLISSIYEMGSIFKPLTLAAALDAGAITAETEYFDQGFVVLNRRRIENYDGKARGRVNMQTVLNKSLNTGAVFAAQALGKDRFKSYIIRYGLNKKTGIDLPGEITGKIDNLNSNRDIEFATASFGQGVAVTPIEFAVAASSLANGGKVITPRLVDRIILNNDFLEENEENGDDKKQKNTIKIEGRPQGETIKKETSEKITAMLTRVVDEALLGGAAKQEHYSIAAKTGTAQIIKGNERGYSESYLHTFFGYAPSFDAKFLTVLILERPVGVKYGSQSLGPAFIDIMKFLINYYEVPPDR